MKDGPRRVLFPMEPSEPVLAAKITGPGEGAQLSRVLDEGTRAVSLRVDDVAGVAGFLVPGDRVDVVLTRDVDGTNRGNVILQGVKVLTIDQTADQRAEQPQIARAVTVEVDPAGAQKIALARAVGTLSLALRPAGEAGPAAVAGITADDLTATARTELPAAAPTVDAAPAAAPAGDSTTVWVSRAFQRTAYKVPSRERPGWREPDPAVAPAAPAKAPHGPAAEDVPVSEAPAAPHLVADRAPARFEDTDVR